MKIIIKKTISFYQTRQFTEALNQLKLLAVSNQVLFKEVATAFLKGTVPSM
jgi:hypothetical protein